MALFQVCVNIDPMQTVMTVRDDSGQVVQRSVKPPRWGLLPEGAIDLIKLESALIELGYRRPPTADWVMGHWSARTVAEPAQRPEAATTVYDPETLREILGLVSSVVDSLDDPEVRRRWFVEVCRRGVVANFQNALETQHWQNYVVAKAASISYDGGLRESLEQAIRASENAYAEGMAGFYEALGKVLGRRVKTDFSDGGDVRSAWVSLAHTGAALMEGMVLRNAVLPNAPRDKSDPFGTGDEA
ncbi:MAG: hypothetical protein WAW17_03990, partial [Rhodococcus sp. (in: high G+C Gram-positive bacteria)]|uniref:hypothetical protein n=1 Tax=Rhodococcus sp. TaxID=1831 RepID=UPI003BB1C0E5